MILIFGGAYQGKLDYVLERFGLTDEDMFKCGDGNTNMPESKKIIYGLDRWILAMVKADMDIGEAIRNFIGGNLDAVVICDDISCGVVPVDPELRKWREAVGRALAEISRASVETVRLFCGIPLRIK